MRRYIGIGQKRSPIQITSIRIYFWAPFRKNISTSSLTTKIDRQALVGQPDIQAYIVSESDSGQIFFLEACFKDFLIDLQSLGVIGDFHLCSVAIIVIGFCGSILCDQLFHTNILIQYLTKRSLNMSTAYPTSSTLI